MPGTPEPTVFIVDDDEAVRDSLHVLLEAHGYSVASFESAAAFTDEYQVDQSGCVLLDIRMPGVDGLTLLKELTDKRSPLSVIMITGHGDVPSAIRAMKAGAFDFLEKPFTEDIILDSLTRAFKSLDRTERDRTTAVAATAHFERLTEREREVMRCLVGGLTNKEIARQLDISPRTVEIHRSRIMEKMEARTLSNLVRIALVAGLGERTS